MDFFGFFAILYLSMFISKASHFKNNFILYLTCSKNSHFDCRVRWVLRNVCTLIKIQNIFMTPKSFLLILCVVIPNSIPWTKTTTDVPYVTVLVLLILKYWYSLRIFYQWNHTECINSSFFCLAYFWDSSVYQ